MRILVSSCILGDNCKYNGKNKKNLLAIDLMKNHEIISICPEILAGMPTPRPCAEIVNGMVIDENGNDELSNLKLRKSISRIHPSIHYIIRETKQDISCCRNKRWYFSRNVLSMNSTIREIGQKDASPKRAGGDISRFRSSKS